MSRQWEENLKRGLGVQVFAYLAFDKQVDDVDRRGLSDVAHMRRSACPANFSDLHSDSIGWSETRLRDEDKKCWPALWHIHRAASA
jgi:hypothetical protein